VISLNISDVKGVEVENEFGKVRFLDSVSLAVKVQDAIKITKNSIIIEYENWKLAKREHTHYNF
jgi:hypothetical protein